MAFQVFVSPKLPQTFVSREMSASIQQGNYAGRKGKKFNLLQQANHDELKITSAVTALWKHKTWS